MVSLFFVIFKKEALEMVVISLRLKRIPQKEPVGSKILRIKESVKA